MDAFGASAGKADLGGADGEGGALFGEGGLGESFGDCEGEKGREVEGEWGILGEPERKGELGKGELFEELALGDFALGLLDGDFEFGGVGDGDFALLGGLGEGGVEFALLGKEGLELRGFLTSERGLVERGLGARNGVLDEHFVAEFGFVDAEIGELLSEFAFVAEGNFLEIRDFGLAEAGALDGGGEFEFGVAEAAGVDGVGLSFLDGDFLRAELGVVTANERGEGGEANDGGGGSKAELAELDQPRKEKEDDFHAKLKMVCGEMARGGRGGEMVREFFLSKFAKRRA